MNQRPWLDDYKTPSTFPSVRPYARLPRFYINLNISFIYKEPNGRKTEKKQNGRHSQLFENHKGALIIEILQLASTNLHIKLEKLA